MSKSFHVFLIHNSQDKPIVRDLAQALKLYDLRVWLDEEQLMPGRIWQENLETIIQTTQTAAVLIGEGGLGPWENPEMRACLSEFVKRKLPVIPVLLPGHTPAEPKLPLFLQSFTWVDLRDGLTDPGLEKLVWGITGVKLTKPSRVFGNLNGDQLQPTSMPLFSKCAASLPRPLSIQIPKEPPSRLAGDGLHAYFDINRIKSKDFWEHHRIIAITFILTVFIFLFTYALSSYFFNKGPNNESIEAIVKRHSQETENVILKHSEEGKDGIIKKIEELKISVATTVAKQQPEVQTQRDDPPPTPIQTETQKELVVCDEENPPINCLWRE